MESSASCFRALKYSFAGDNVLPLILILAYLQLLNVMSCNLGEAFEIIIIVYVDAF